MDSKTMKDKTFKREYAFVLMCFLGYMIYTDNVEMLDIAIWPFLSFVATSAGLHIYDRKSNTSASFVRSNFDAS